MTVYLLDWTELGGRQYVGATHDLAARLESHRTQPLNSLRRRGQARGTDNAHHR